MVTEQVKVGWRTPMQITHVQWGDPAGTAGHALVEIDSIRGSAPLWDIVRGREFEVTVNSPRVDGSVNSQGELELQRVAQVALPNTGPSSFCVGHHTHHCPNFSSSSLY